MRLRYFEADLGINLMLGSDTKCRSQVSKLAPCAKAVAGGDYIVWERLPSFASNQTHTDLWQSMQRVKLFTQMYTINPITSIAETGDQNYLCGG